VPKRVQDDLLRYLGRARAIGVAAHPVDNHEQCALLSNRGRDPVLVLLAPAQQAYVGVVHPQEDSVLLLDLILLLYHPAANERSYRSPP
jgi:hypothetical protein